MKTFQELKKNLKKNYNNFLKLKIAILGDTATQLLTQAVQGYCYEYKINPVIFEADFNQIERQIFDLSSELYSFKPDFIVILFSSEKLWADFSKIDMNKRYDFADNNIEKIKQLYNQIISNLNSKVIFFNFEEFNDNVFGNYSNKVKSSFIFQIRRLNYLLMEFASESDNFYILDINGLQSYYGRKNTIDKKIFINTEILWNIDFIPIIAKNVLDVISSIKGFIKKCVILDLDNTMWGGIIGDDGVEKIQVGELGIGKAFTSFQLWIKQLKERGIILTICSKNTEEIAKEPFLKHPDMIIRLEDIAVFVANWENKADNIKYIQEILNIGFDSMVFIDDNPFERNMVRENVSGVVVPEMPEDPAVFLDYLFTQNLFETASFSGEDNKRTKRYQEEAKRKIAQKSFTNEREFLRSLNMVSTVEPFNSFNTPRIAQLTQRSNQFNLRTIRYNELDIKKISSNKNFRTFAFDLKDKYGEYGIISLIILKKISPKEMFIDSWIMSCRVLKRTMEVFVLNTIVEEIKKEGITTLIGEYIPTPKNKLVENHYTNLGFESKNGKYYLEINDFNYKETFIKRKKI